jgi:D-glycero-D-manno-heptose 1,7-bisphosphate phosphatase
MNGEHRPHRALFLDRDGVVNVEIGYLHRIEDVRWVPGIVPLCRTARDLGYKVIVVTNQAGIARGFYTEDDFFSLMAWIRAELRRDGVEFDAVYFCPFHPTEGVGSYRCEHEDRKPGPGMLLRGAQEFGLDLKQSILVGDRCSDIGAANAAGLRQAFLLAGTDTVRCSGDYLSIKSLAEVEHWLQLQK